MKGWLSGAAAQEWRAFTEWLGSKYSDSGEAVTIFVYYRLSTVIAVQGAAADQDIRGILSKNLTSTRRRASALSGACFNQRPSHKNIQNNCFKQCSLN